MNYATYIIKLYDLKFKLKYDGSSMIVDEYTDGDNCIDDLGDYNYWIYD